ncbi:MAG: small ribosomal subunit Rsm22 family protein [Candidatus Methylacidiphilales bacterium]|nr:small ribosomal subunit Rsm22 family protein [Candidatus Methylacidiphilales bacterium]
MKAPALYPSHLEAWWLERLQHRYGDTLPARLYARTLPHIRLVSDSFTRDRADQFRKSYQERENLLAYGTFFFPQTYSRVLLVLEELSRVHGWKPPTGGKCRVLDLGSGLGAGSLAVADHLRPHPEGLEITAVEQHKTCTESHQKLIRDLGAYGNPLRWNFLPGDFREIDNWAPRPNYRWNLILLSFSFNEAFADAPPEAAAEWLHQVLGRLESGGLLVVVEPALKETAESLETVRDLLLAHDKNHIWAPCLHRQSCPARSGGQFWCHEARKWSPPASLVLLNSSLHREIETLKFSFLALSRTPPPARDQGPGTTRMVSPVSKTQGRMHFHGCSSDGDIHHFDLLTRHLDAAGKKAWWALERGSILNGLATQSLGGDKALRLTEPDGFKSSGAPHSVG